jgi:DNA-binding response OmpR family regulator
MSENFTNRILIVDDDALFIKSLCDTLQSEGYLVVAASGGQAGIDAFQSAFANESFALVITDLGMQNVDGRQVAVAIKNISPATPIILLTGWGQWFEKDERLPLPIDYILGKPPKLRELRETIARCLEPAKFETNV